MKAFRKLVALLLSVMLSTSAFAISDDRVFSFAEAKFPSIFTGLPTSGQFQQYNYRYYPPSGNYLAVDTLGNVVILGQYTGGVLSTVGPAASFETAIIEWEKVVKPIIPSMNSVSLISASVTTNGPIVIPPTILDPTVPAKLTAAPAGTNFKLWIFDPRNRNVALGSPGIFIKSETFDWRLVGATSKDGSFYMKLDPGTYDFDVLEPSGTSNTLTRKRYRARVSSAGVVTLDEKVVDTQGYFAVTVNVVATNTEAAYRLSALTALANESSLTFRPTSDCQLLDQVTTTRRLNVDLSAGFPKVRTRLPSYGRIRALIVPVDFSDVPGVDNPVTFFKPIAEGVRDFYFNSSYGRLAFDFEILPNWVRVPFLATKYNMGSTVGAGDPGGYRKEIVDLAESLIDYNQYDAVYFLVPKQMPMSVMGWGPAITSPIMTSTGYITNGASGGADMYLPQNGTYAARNWMAHETGHAFGLYDQDLNHASATLGNWSLMANSWSRNAIELGGWDRYLQGWFSDYQVSCLPMDSLTKTGTTVKLSPLVRQTPETKVAMVPLSTSKILVMESRKSEGFDIIAAGREGVLIYTVDMKIGQLKGGYQTQRRSGSTDRFFEDAALRNGDSVIVDSVVVTVVELGSSGDTIRIGVK